MTTTNLRTRLVLSFAAAALTLGVSSAAFATDETDGMIVSATVVGSCSITAADLAFGNYDPVEGADVPGTATVSVTCSSGTAWTISLDKGLAADFTVRTMKDAGTNYLNYNLYKEVGHTTVWGDATGATETVSGTGNGSAQNTTIYGLIPTGQNTAVVGSYSETITATVTY